MCRSNLPGLNNALSNTSALFVEANIMTFSFAIIPSISTKTSLNKCLTRAAPKPPNTSINSEPFIDKKGTLASVATALASNVLPHPGASFNPATSPKRTPLPFPINGSTRVNFACFICEIISKGLKEKRFLTKLKAIAVINAISTSLIILAIYSIFLS
ncbi:hypothetical protein ALC62_14901 [Cyphomyrmex costatus]|uniref:Uncharacterized protein n=1 Tax=Cyphomyrmex costatus TaxID=456900 RepID=A0A195C2P0_9HYME|nr:hypothetical protein ALC62_14901 [Cyphomyrmex costatus]